jgi:hypothetical protein
MRWQRRASSLLSKLPEHRERLGMVGLLLVLQRLGDLAESLVETGNLAVHLAVDRALALGIGLSPIGNRALQAPF